MSTISANGVLQLHFIDDLISLRGSEKEQPDILACADGTSLDRYEYFTAKRLDNLINNAAHVIRKQGFSLMVIPPPISHYNTLVLRSTKSGDESFY